MDASEHVPDPARPDPARPGPADRERAVVAAVPTQLWIGGSWRPSAGGRTLEVQDPATGAVLTEVADAAPADGDAALAAAAAAQEGWAAAAPRERAEVLRRGYALMVERVEDLALLMTLEMGKALAESRAEVLYAADFLRWFSEEAVRVAGRWQTAPDGGSRLLTMRQPVGPCLLITPWNFPLAMGTRKIGPAVAAGCTMVVKPAAQTPLSMLALAALLHEAGLPAGVLNVVPTSDAAGVTGPLIADARLRKLSFTGSTPVGRRLVADAAERLLRTSMELGGNAPFVVMPDADLDAAVEGAMQAKMRNVGEACTAANRFLVHRDVADGFTQALTDRMAALRVGRGTEDGVDVGPLIEDRARRKVDDLVQDAVAAGARVTTGGSAVDGPGWFYEPTVLTDVPPQARIAAEEIFGPVAPVTTFATEQEALALANASEYGLVSYLWTQDLSTAIRMAERLEAGMVGLNRGVVSNASAPFGGVKSSGFGREGGLEGIDEYLETKYVSVGL